MKQMRRRVSVIFMVVLTYSLSVLFTSAAEDAPSILKKTSQTMANLNSFVAHLSGRRFEKKTVYWKQLGDGFAELRIDRINLRTGRTNTHIFNRSGTWFIWRGEALKCKTPSSSEFGADYMRQLLAGVFSSKTDLQCEYSVLNTNYHGVECYLVRQKILNPGLVASVIRNSASASVFDSAGKRAIDIVVPSIIDYIIAKSNSFLYAKIQRDGKGDPMSSLEYDSVQINPVIPGKMFEVPSTMKQVEFESRAALVTYMANRVRGQTGVPLKAPPTKKARVLVVGLLVLSSIIAVWIIILSVIRNHQPGENNTT